MTDPADDKWDDVQPEHRRYRFRRSRTYRQLADHILGYLRTPGVGEVSRTAIHRFLCRHYTSQALDIALALLTRDGLVRSRKLHPGGWRKPIQLWHALPTRDRPPPRFGRDYPRPRRCDGPVWS